MGKSWEVKRADSCDVDAPDFVVVVDGGGGDFGGSKSGKTLTHH